MMPANCRLFVETLPPESQASEQENPLGPFAAGEPTSGFKRPPNCRQFFHAWVMSALVPSPALVSNYASLSLQSAPGRFAATLSFYYNNR